MRQSFIKPAERITACQVPTVFLAAAGSRCTLKCYKWIQVLPEPKLFPLALLIIPWSSDQSLLLDLHRKVWKMAGVKMVWPHQVMYFSTVMYFFLYVSIKLASCEVGFGLKGLLWYSNVYRTFTTTCLVGKLNYIFLCSGHLCRAFWWLPQTFVNPWVIKLYFVHMQLTFENHFQGLFWIAESQLEFKIVMQNLTHILILFVLPFLW